MWLHFGSIARDTSTSDEDSELVQVTIADNLLPRVKISSWGSTFFPFIGLLREIPNDNETKSPRADEQDST